MNQLPVRKRRIVTPVFEFEKELMEEIVLYIPFAFQI